MQGGGQVAGLGAQAYTHGSDLHFGAGQYAPGAGNSQLLGHELAHVVQQGGAPMPDINTAVGHYAR